MTFSTPMKGSIHSIHVLLCRPVDLEQEGREDREGLSSPLLPVLSGLPVHLSVLLAALLMLSGCAVGPNYTRPAAPVPVAFKEAAGWKPATPGDATERGPWWEALHDPLLSELEAKASAANPSLLAAAANYEQARQLARADRATLFPSLSVSGSAGRAQASTARSATMSGAAATSTASASANRTATNSYAASLAASWAPDFWGRVRRLGEAELATAQASAADLANARLSIQAALATDYGQLRIADERIRLRENAVEAYRRTLAIAQNKYNVGIVARSDVISAQALLDAARAQAIDAGIVRAQLEHAIAVLIGQPPSAFTLAPQPALNFAVPAVPARLPSELLERRPDVAAAERRVAAANARIGVQTAAFFPNVTLSATGGFESGGLTKLFTVPARFWSLGADAADALLDFGRRRAEVAAARAAYDGSVAGYRGAVLEAFQQVEDRLAGLRLLADEARIQDAAVQEAAEAARIALNEYNAGIADYTTVVAAQVAELNNRQAALGILEGRLTSTVALIEALGGGWQAMRLPEAGEIRANRGETRDGR